MDNANTIKQRLDAVKKSKSYTEALHVLADTQLEIGIAACKDREGMKAQLHEVRTELMGNGDPENSVLVRLKGVEKVANASKDTLDGLDEDFRGSAKEPGVLERIRNVEKMVDGLKKIGWAIILAVLVDLATGLFTG